MANSPIQPPIVKLVPFPLLHEAHTRSFRIWVNAEVTYTDLRVRFRLEAAGPKEFSKIILPEPASKPSRQKDLWKETCFECFIPAANSEAYLELNGSPSGHWNLFAFKKYRDRAIEFELGQESLPKQSVVTRTDRQIENEWVIPLTAIRQGFVSVGAKGGEFKKIGITTVLNTSVATTYWALKHDGIKPDFHVGSSFIYPIQS
jgi:hypothetical protein